MIYDDLRKHVKTGLDEIEADGVLKLNTFPSLIKDIFQSLYSLNPRLNDVDILTTNARRYNAEILNYLMSSNEYTELKLLCEGQELPAYEAVSGFVTCIFDKLDELLNTDAIEELNTLEQQQADLKTQLLKAMERSDPNSADDILNMEEHIADNDKKLEQLFRMVSRRIRKNKGAIQSAIITAKEKAQEASGIIKSWGNGDSSPEAIQQNTELLRRVQSSQKLRDIIKYLGKYREILDSIRKSNFIYGRGDKYDIVLGNDFTRAVSSEYAYLALPETIPLFIQKVQRKTLKQYRKRERIADGHGDIVVCIDESGSMSGEPIAWAKAVALVMLEYVSQNNRSCAMVRFASAKSIVTHVYKPKQYTTEDVFVFAESFLSGGTDFEAPLTQAVKLIEHEGFENADIMFITDGECGISDEFARDFCDKSEQLKFSVFGIVIDTDKPGMVFSLSSFCKKVYRLSEMTGDNIAAAIVARKTQ